MSLIRAQDGQDQKQLWAGLLSYGPASLKGVRAFALSREEAAVRHRLACCWGAPHR